MNAPSEKYKATLEQSGSTYDKVDHLFFNLELRLGSLADKRSKVAYKDIFAEITDARIVLAKLFKKL